MTASNNQGGRAWPAHAAEITLRGGQVGRYLGICPQTGKHRVQTTNQNQAYTTWLLDDAGRCRGDLVPCEQDYVGGTS